MKRNLFFSVIAAILVFFADRITKYWALKWLRDTPFYYNQLVSFELAFNRGISWSLFHSSNYVVFVLVTLFIALIITLLAYYTYCRIRAGYAVFGCLLALSGAFSNFIDRLCYQAVVDFILLSYHGFTWPIFNIADICIVIGITIMAFNEL